MRNEMTQFEKAIETMTSEQYIKIVEIAHGKLPENIKKMTDEELLKELGV